MSDSWKAERKIVTFPVKGSQTPEVVLVRTLEKARAGHIKQLAVVIVWDDEGESVAADWSEGKLSSLLFAAASLRIVVEDNMRSNWIDTEESAEPPDAV